MKKNDAAFAVLVLTAMVAVQGCVKKADGAAPQETAVAVNEANAQRIEQLFSTGQKMRERTRRSHALYG
jgi:hypothetical protein